MDDQQIDWLIHQLINRLTDKITKPQNTSWHLGEGWSIWLLWTAAISYHFVNNSLGVDSNIYLKRPYHFVQMIVFVPCYLLLVHSMLLSLTEVTQSKTIIYVQNATCWQAAFDHHGIGCRRGIIFPLKFIVILYAKHNIHNTIMIRLLPSACLNIGIMFNYTKCTIVLSDSSQKTHCQVNLCSAVNISTNTPHITNFMNVTFQAKHYLKHCWFW